MNSAFIATVTKYVHTCIVPVSPPVRPIGKEILTGTFGFSMKF